MSLLAPVQTPDLSPEDWRRIAHGLRLLTVEMAVGSVAVAFGCAATVRRWGRRASWVLCLSLAAVLVFAVLMEMAATWPAILHPLWSAVYMVSALFAVPLAMANAVVNRSMARHPERSLGAHAARGWLGFLTGFVLGLVLACIPDLMELLA